MAKTVKVAFEIDAEEVKKIIEVGKGKTTRLTAADVDKLRKNDVIKASDLLTGQIAKEVGTIFTKMQWYPDQAATLINKMSKQFIIPKEHMTILVKQHVMFYAGLTSILPSEKLRRRK